MKNIIECPYCKRFCRGGHYIPPSLDDAGFAACKSFWKHDDEDLDVQRMNEKYGRTEHRNY